MAIWCFWRARKERARILGGVIALLMAAIAILPLLGQALLVVSLLVVLIIVEVVAYPKAMEMGAKDITKQARGVDVSAPLSVRDFRTMAAWVKLASRWGVRNAIILFVLPIGLIIGCLSFIMGKSLAEIVFSTVTLTMINASLYYPLLKISLSNLSTKQRA